MGQEKYKDDKFLHRLVYSSFAECANSAIIDFIMTKMEISNEKIAEIIPYKDNKILVDTMSNNIKMVKKIHSILGEKEFVHLSLESNNDNINAFEAAVKESIFSNFQYLASFEDIKAVYMNKENDKIRFRLVYHALTGCKNDDIFDAVLKEFNFDKTEIIKLMNFKYPPPAKKFGYGEYKYRTLNIVGQVISENTLNRLKKLLSLIGQKEFIQNVLMSDGNNVNGLEYAIKEKKIDIIQYLFSFDDIQKEYETNKELVWRCVFWMSHENYHDEYVASYLMKTLNLNEEKLRELQKFKCIRTESENADEYKYYYEYWNKSIDDDDVNLLLNGKK